MFASIKSYLFSKLVSAYFKTNGWKSILGYIIAFIVAKIVAMYPGVPAEAVSEILSWIGDAILTAGVLDRLRKNILDAAPAAVAKAPKIVEANILKSVLFALVLFAPCIAMAQATPTPTNTITPLSNSPRGDVISAQANWRALITVAATAVPTAYATPQIAPGQYLKNVDVVNDMDCTVIVSLDGAGADNYVIPTKSAWSPPLAEMKFYQKLGINLRSTAACTTGSLYISGAY